MNEIVPRYEFRAFAQTFGLAAEKIRSCAPCDAIQESAELYLVSKQDDVHNVKVRGGQLDIKQLVEETGRLERWKPVAKETFPVSRNFVLATLLPALGLREAAVDRDRYPLDVLVNELVRVTPFVCPVCVFKRRFRFTVSSCPTEIDELLVNGAAIRSIAVESENCDAVLDVVEKVRLNEYDNVSYPLALRRIVGLAPLTDEESYG